MGPNQTKSISMGPIWNTSGTETVISIPVSKFNLEVVQSQMLNEPEARHYYDILMIFINISLEFCLEEIISIDPVKIKQQV